MVHSLFFSTVMNFFPTLLCARRFHQFFLPCQPHFQPPLLFKSGWAWSVFPTLLCARRWNSVEIEFQNPSLAARPRPSASLIISVNLLIKMSCKRFPSFHSDHYQHARPPAEYRSFSPLPALHTFQRSSTLFDAKRPKKWKISNAPKSSEPAQLSDSILKIWGIKR